MTDYDNYTDANLLDARKKLQKYHDEWGIVNNKINERLFPLNHTNNDWLDLRMPSNTSINFSTNGSYT